MANRDGTGPEGKGPRTGRGYGYCKDDERSEQRQRKNTKGFGITRMTKDYVGAGVLLGAGSSVLQGMGQGAIAGNVITPASNMMGPVMSAGYGMAIVDKLKSKAKKEKEGNNEEYKI